MKVSGWIVNEVMARIRRATRLRQEILEALRRLREALLEAREIRIPRPRSRTFRGSDGSSSLAGLRKLCV